MILILDIECVLTKCICYYIAPRSKSYCLLGFQTIIDTSNSIVVETAKGEYKVELLVENSAYYWKVSPYMKSYYVTPYMGYESFEMVLFAIKEHEKSLLLDT